MTRKVLPLLLVAALLWLAQSASPAAAGWKVDSLGRLVYHGTGQVLSKGTDSTERESPDGPTPTRAVSPTEPQARIQEDSAEDQTEDDLDEADDLETEVEDDTTRPPSTRVRLEQRDGRLIITTEDEDGIEAELEDDDDLLEIEGRLDRRQIRVATGSGMLIFARGSAAARTSLPLEVNLDTNELVVTTPAGTRTVTILPDSAITNLLAANIIDRLSPVESPADVGELTGITSVFSLSEKDGVPIYEITGESDQKLLIFFPVSIKKAVIVSAQTGEIIQTRLSWSQRILDLLAF